MPQKYEGKIKKIIFRDEKSGFTVALFSTFSGENFTIAGDFSSINEKNEISIFGDWTTHRRYGRQFSVINYTIHKPETLDDKKEFVLNFLSERIGGKLAEHIVDKFKENAISILDNEIEKLLEVKGIGQKKLQRIKNEWQSQKEFNSIALELLKYGISSNLTMKLFKEYGKDSIRVVKENPYKITEDIEGIGFLKADLIAEKLGVSKFDEKRIYAGIIYALSRHSENGSVCASYDWLAKVSSESLEIDFDSATNCLDQLIDEGKLILETHKNSDKLSDIESEGKTVYLPKYYYSEIEAAENIFRIAKSKTARQINEADEIILIALKKKKLEFDKDQIKAVKESLRNKIFIITGCPGSGKTTIARLITEIFENAGMKIELAAPTGRAAKKLSEAVGREAKTIHRLLEYNPSFEAFNKDEENQIEADLIIVDEISMADLLLFNSLLKAIKDSAHVIFMGDADQLPSVGAGNVLKDLLASEHIKSFELKEIYRQAKESSIIVNAHKIKNGEEPVLSLLEEKKDFAFIEANSSEKMLKIILELARKVLPSEYNFNSVKDIQILSPIYRGLIGVDNLNHELRNLLNPYGEEIKIGGKSFKKGDKIMQLRNNYETDIFNGDIGIIASVEPNGVIVDFERKKVKYDDNTIHELGLAYASSVHKAQGGEYPAVIMPITNQHGVMLQRNLLYTAVTRGKLLTVLVGEKSALRRAIGNTSVQKRNSSLKNRIDELF